MGFLCRKLKFLLSSFHDHNHYQLLFIELLMCQISKPSLLILQQFYKVDRSPLHLQLPSFSRGLLPVSRVCPFTLRTTQGGRVIPVTCRFDHVTPVSKTLQWLLFLLSTKGKVSQVAQTPQGPAPRFLPSSRKPPRSPCSMLSSHIGPSLLFEHAPHAPAQGLFPLLFLLLGMFLP